MIDREQLEGYPLPTDPAIIQVRFFGSVEDVDEVDMEVYQVPNEVQRFMEFRDFHMWLTNQLVDQVHVDRPTAIRMVDEFSDRLYNYRILEFHVPTQRIVCPVGWVQTQRDGNVPSHQGKDWMNW